MPSFPYVARTSQGTMERGILDAESVSAAKAKLHAKGWTIEEIAGDSIIGFSETPAWTTIPNVKKTAPTPPSADTTIMYVPIMQTIRLFAGWLMAWYGIIYIAGGYRADGRLPYDIPLIQSLAASDLVLRFAFGVFLFLLLTDLYRWTGRKAVIGVALGILGLGLMWVFHVNV